MGEMGYGGAEYLGIGESGGQDGEVGKLGVGLRMEGGGEYGITGYSFRRSWKVRSKTWLASMRVR